MYRQFVLGRQGKCRNVEGPGARCDGSDRRQDAELRRLHGRYGELCSLLQQGIANVVGEAEIVQELQSLSDRVVALQTRAGAMSGSGNAPSTKPEENAPGTTNEITRNFERMLAMLERQTTQVERVLHRCNENRDRLERVERRLIETTPLLERQLPELRDAVDHQRQRVTALAIAVERLSQWLVTQQGSGSNGLS